MMKYVYKLDFKGIALLFVSMSAVAGAGLLVWYYFAVIIPDIEVVARNRHLEAQVESYKKQYCVYPYRNDIVKKFCQRNDFVPKI